VIQIRRNNIVHSLQRQDWPIAGLKTALAHHRVVAVPRLRKFTITGRLGYQACDDRICFVPKSVPVLYVIRLRLPGGDAAGA
jgi:hypothetical protein